eukprot:9549584-Ditylum_brightwellii.AAC.1
MLTYNPTQHQLPIPPPHAKFTQIRTMKDQIICIHPIDSVLLDPQTNDPVSSSFEEYLTSLDPGLKRLLGNLPQQEIDIETYAVVFQAREKAIRFQGPVDGHPSLIQEFHPIPLPAQLNCIADADASKYMDTEYTNSTTPPLLFSAVATLTVNGVVVTSKMKEVLRDASCCADIHAYVQGKTGWTLVMM